VTAFVLFQQRPDWQAVFWFSFVAWFAIEMWIAARDRRGASGERRDRGSRLVIYVFVWTAIAIAFAAPYRVSAARMAFPNAPVFWTAIVLMWAGTVLRTWAVVTLGRFFRSTVHIHDDHKLVTSGPYRVLRHPGYTGGLMTTTGIGLAQGNSISLAAAFFLLLVAYVWRIVVEEAALRARFGEAFEAYRRKTWAIIPPVW